VVTELGTKVDPRDSKVEVDGQRIVAESLVYVVIHKPRGVVSTMSDPEGRPSVRELLAHVPVASTPSGASTSRRAACSSRPTTATSPKP